MTDRTFQVVMGIAIAGGAGFAAWAWIWVVRGWRDLVRMSTELKVLEAKRREIGHKGQLLEAQQAQFEERHQARLRALDAMRVVSSAVDEYPEESPEARALTAVFRTLETRMEASIDEECDA